MAIPASVLKGALTILGKGNTYIQSSGMGLRIRNWVINKQWGDYGYVIPGLEDMGWSNSGPTVESFAGEWSSREKGCCRGNTSR